MATVGHANAPRFEISSLVEQFRQFTGKSGCSVERRTHSDVAHEGASRDDHARARGEQHGGLDRGIHHRRRRGLLHAETHPPSDADSREASGHANTNLASGQANTNLPTRSTPCVRSPWSASFDRWGGACGREGG